MKHSISVVFLDAEEAQLKPTPSLTPSHQQHGSASAGLWHLLLMLFSFRYLKIALFMKLCFIQEFYMFLGFTLFLYISLSVLYLFENIRMNLF